MAHYHCFVRCGGAVPATGEDSAVREGVPRVARWDPNTSSMETRASIGWAGPVLGPDCVIAGMVLAPP